MTLQERKEIEKTSNYNNPNTPFPGFSKSEDPVTEVVRYDQNVPFFGGGILKFLTVHFIQTSREAKYHAHIKWKYSCTDVRMPIEKLIFKTDSSKYEMTEINTASDVHVTTGQYGVMTTYYYEGHFDLTRKMFEDICTTSRLIIRFNAPRVYDDKEFAGDGLKGLRDAYQAYEKNKDNVIFMDEFLEETQAIISTAKTVIDKNYTNIVLIESGENKIETAKLIMSISHCSLEQAIEYTKQTPVVVGKVFFDGVDRVVKQFEEIGAKVEAIPVVNE